MAGLHRRVTRLVFVNNSLAAHIELVDEHAVEELLDSLQRAVCQACAGASAGVVNVIQGGEHAVAQALARGTVPGSAAEPQVSVSAASADEDSEDGDARSVTSMEVDLYCHEIMDERVPVSLATATLTSILACPEDEEGYRAPVSVFAEAGDISAEELTD
uniref:MC007L n=1 Tax=Rousettus bat poxvirus TaxID=3141933 RepID=A0AAU7E207_9POXV